MGYERYPRNINPQADYYDRSEPMDYGQDYGSGRAYTYSSARDYEAAGEIGSRGRGRDYYGGYRNADARDYGPREYGYGGYNRFGSGGGRAYYGQDSNRGSHGSDGRRFRDDRGDDRGQGSRRFDARDGDDRGFWDRAGDEVRSWFGDEDAERRREMDMRRDEARHGDDPDYHSWRRGQIAALDRDYDEYRRENQSRFDNEFGSWRQERQSQRNSLSRVDEHMDVVGSDGAHVGTVDKVRGDRILLTKSDKDAGGHHHSIPSRWIQSVDGKVTLRKTADEAQAHWKDEERNTAMFGEGRDNDSDPQGRILNRSFSGTY